MAMSILISTLHCIWAGGGGHFSAQPPPSSLRESWGGRKKQHLGLTFLAIWFFKGQHHKITTTKTVFFSLVFKV